MICKNRSKIDLDPKSRYPHNVLFGYMCVFAVVFLAQYLFGTAIGLTMTFLALLGGLILPYVIGFRHGGF